MCFKVWIVTLLGLGPRVMYLLTIRPSEYRFKITHGPEPAAVTHEEQMLGRWQQMARRARSQIMRT